MFSKYYEIYKKQIKRSMTIKNKYKQNSLKIKRVCINEVRKQLSYI